MSNNNGKNCYEPEMSHLISHWSVQERLLQTYRSRLYTIQSILLGFAGIFYTLLNKDETLLNNNIFGLLKIRIIIHTPYFLFGIVSLVIFIIIISKREKTVEFCQFLIMEKEENKELFTKNPMTWMKDNKPGKLIPDDKKPKKNEKTKKDENRVFRIGWTRKMHRYILYPILFLFWAIYLLLIISIECPNLIN